MRSSITTPETEDAVPTLEGLFHPSAVAVVGATDRWGFTREAEEAGLPVLAIDALPDDPD